MTDDERENQSENSEADQDNCFIVASGRELMDAFGLTAENRPIIHLNPENVPAELRALIPYAEAWGISDDLIRGDVLDKASPEALKDFVKTISVYDDAISEWLTDPEADHNPHTKEYYVFSALIMAFDEARYSIT